MTANITRKSLLSNIALALADEHTVERNGRVIENIASQLCYAGVEVSASDLRTALDAVASPPASVFNAVQPSLERRQGHWGEEYRFRPSEETYTAARACIEAIYRVTDTLDRTPVKYPLPTGGVVELETTRPRAFAICMGFVRTRWARGNFKVPSEAVIRAWLA